jgi:hypothetical protein
MTADSKIKYTKAFFIFFVKLNKFCKTWQVSYFLYEQKSKLLSTCHVLITTAKNEKSKKSIFFFDQHASDK